MECVFCKIVDGTAPATVLHRWPDAIAITPLNPVVRGHVLIIPRAHTHDFAVDPVVAAGAMARAAEYARRMERECNLITSRGGSATQTVFHLHLHIVPRRPGDGLALPWTGQEVLDA